MQFTIYIILYYITVLLLLLLFFYRMNTNMGSKTLAGFNVEPKRACVQSANTAVLWPFATFTWVSRWWCKDFRWMLLELARKQRLFRLQVYTGQIPYMLPGRMV